MALLLVPHVAAGSTSIFGEPLDSHLASCRIVDGMPSHDAYRTPGPMTWIEPDERIGPLLEGLPADPIALARIAPGVVVHEFLTSLYGLPPAPPRLDEIELRAASDIVARIAERDARPLREARPPDARVQGNCRMF